MLHILIEKTKKAIDWIVEEIYWQKNWRTLLVLIDVVLFLAFNPSQWLFPNFLTPFPQLLSYGWYRPAFFSLLSVIFIGALIAAACHKRKPTETEDLKPGAIKGLLPFRYEDAEDFAHLQRCQNLKEFLEAIGDDHWRFGVLTGISGVGKTSFLQAGLWPALEKSKARCVYVKFSDLDPFESVRRACRKHLPACGGAADDADFLSLLRAATAQDSSPVVLLFDQFEQFFIQYRHKSDRAAFVQALTQWFTTMESLPIKLLICTRVAFLDQLNELHKAMKYSLGPAQDFRLERFEPDQATEIICYLAEKEGLEYDREFIAEMARGELASETVDGLIFPYDIQILARMVQRQTVLEGRPFNRSTFQKLGGMEGLLYRYLMSTLGARETQARRRTAVKVLLALADPEGICGDALTMEAIRARLGGGVSDAELKEAVSWLQRGDVRLISPHSEIEEDKFELAHDRMRPELHQVANKQRSDAERFRQHAGWCLGLLLVVIGWIVINTNLWQTYLIKRDLRYAGNNLNDNDALAEIAQAFLYAGDPQFSLQVVKRIHGDYYKGSALRAFAEYYIELGETMKDGSLMAEAIKTAERIGEGSAQVDALRAFAKYYAKVGDKEKARSLLAEASETAERIRDRYFKESALREIAESYAELGDIEKARSLLAEAIEMTERIGDERLSDSKNFTAKALSSIAAVYARLAETRKDSSLMAEAIETAERISDGYYKADALHWIAEYYAKFGDQEKARSLLAEAIETAERSDSSSKADALREIAEAYAWLGDKKKASSLLAEAIETAERIDYYLAKDNTMRWNAASYTELIGSIKDSSLLAEASETAELMRDDYSKASALAAIAASYAELGNQEKARSLVAEAIKTAERIRNEVYKDKALREITASSAKLGEMTNDSSLLADAIKTAGRFGNGIEGASALGTVSESIVELGDKEKARSLLAEAIGTAERSGDGIFKVRALGSIAAAYAKLGDKEKARSLVAEAIKAANQIPFRYRTAPALCVIAELGELLNDRTLYEKIFGLLKDDESRDDLLSTILYSKFAIADAGKLRSLTLHYSSRAEKAKALARILMVRSQPELMGKKMEANKPQC